MASAPEPRLFRMPNLAKGTPLPPEPPQPDDPGVVEGVSEESDERRSTAL